MIHRPVHAVRPTLRVVAQAAMLCGAMVASVTSAAACPAPLAAALAEMATACREPTCGSAISTARTEAATKSGMPTCSTPGWDGLLATIEATLAQRGFVLLGEVHDNDTHHAVRAAIVASISTKGSTPAAAPVTPAPIVFEQLSADQRSALAPYMAPPPSGSTRDLAPFLSAIAWDQSPWSKTGNYKPLFDAALKSGRAIHAGDPGRDAMKRSARDGATSIPPEDRSRLQLETPLGDALDQASLAEIETAHCGLMPKAALGGMAYAQRFRDAHLASAVRDAADASATGAILIAGNGHVRADRGVPWYLARMAPDRPILAVLFNEVPARPLDASPTAATPSQPAANWVVMTPPNSERDPDPCAGMRAAFERMRKPAPPKAE